MWPQTFQFSILCHWASLCLRSGSVFWITELTTGLRLIGLVCELYFSCTAWQTFNPLSLINIFFWSASSYVSGLSSSDCMHCKINPPIQYIDRPLIIQLKNCSKDTLNNVQKSFLIWRLHQQDSVQITVNKSVDLCVTGTVQVWFRHKKHLF